MLRSIFRRTETNNLQLDTYTFHNTFQDKSTANLFTI